MNYKASVAACLQCYSNAPAYVESDFCPFYGSLQQCLQQDNCENEAEELKQQLGVASFVSDACSDPECNEVDLVSCISEAFDSGYPSCVETFTETVVCFTRFGCEVGNFFEEVFGESASSCTVDGSNITVDWDACATGYLQTPLDDFDFFDLFDDSCSAAFNVPGCNFDSGKT